MPSIDAGQMRRYANWQTIPLYRHSATKEIKGKTVKLGKRPLHFNWTKRTYNQAGRSSVIDQCIRDERNMGVRLRASDLVLDVDPRNGGDKGLQDLIFDIGLDLKSFPRVVTGSGGLHIYGKKPPGELVVDTLDSYKGVEFKSKGRQVVAAGSLHPDTHKLYLFDDEFPALDNAPEWPKELLNLIRRPAVSQLQGGGQYDQEEIAKMLDKLDPEDFREHGEWLKLMMACHHASNGDARSEFIEWSTQDPNYADDGEIIGRRWDSLHNSKAGAITYKTLKKILTDHDAGDVIPANDATDDFNDDVSSEPSNDKPKKAGDEFDFESGDHGEPSFEGKQVAGGDSFEGDEEEPSDDEEPTWLEKLNREYTAVLDGSKFRIVKKEFDPIMQRYRWLRVAPADFTALYSNKRVLNPRDPDKTVPLGKAWIEWPARNTVSQIIFDPINTDRPDCLNLWTGWAVKENAKGEWGYLREMLFECICDRNEEYLDYLLNWTADMIQHPARPAETAIVFRGGEGVGKGTWGNTIARIFGQHGMAIHSPDLLVGRFNSHLQDLIFLFADEAVKPYDKVAEAKLRALITEKMLSIEGKGRDVISSPNYLHVLMASNERWVVPAAIDARRFFVLDVNDKWKGKFDRWEKLHNQLKQFDGSGYGRLLHDLLARNIPAGFSPARSMPITDALTDQKLNSLSPLQQFFFNALLEGLLPFDHTGDWAKEEVTFFRQDFRDAFSDFVKQNEMRFQRVERGSVYFIIRELVEMFPGSKTDIMRAVPEGRADMPARADGRAKALTLPPLQRCRKNFEERIKGIIRWDKLGTRRESWE